MPWSSVLHSACSYSRSNAHLWPHETPESRSRIAGQPLEGDDRTAVLGGFFDGAVRNPVEHQLESVRLFAPARPDGLVGVT
jgi:hypothetical protein